MQKVLIVLALLLAGAGVYYFYTLTQLTVPAQGKPNVLNPAPSAEMRVEPNAVMVFEELPGKRVVGTLFLEAPGYLVIHEDDNGAHGAIIGSSSLLQAGENADVEVMVNRDMREGETLHAMLHVEKSNNTTFSAAEDIPVESKLGGAIYGIFDITSDASVNPAITI